MSIDRKHFFDTVKLKLFTQIAQSQVDGMTFLLDLYEHSYASTITLPQLAYCLATAYHETGRKMKPCEEIGRGRGLRYGPSGFWGRGYVQITWDYNYKSANEWLARAGVHVDLISNPDRALDPTIAAHIMFIGMRDGDFTGKHLRDYIPADPLHARRIINGMDRAATVESYYQSFNAALKPVKPKSEEAVA